MINNIITITAKIILQTQLISIESINDYYNNYIIWFDQNDQLEELVILVSI